MVQFGARYHSEDFINYVLGNIPLIVLNKLIYDYNAMVLYRESVYGEKRLPVPQIVPGRVNKSFGDTAVRNKKTSKKTETKQTPITSEEIIDLWNKLREM